MNVVDTYPQIREWLGPWLQQLTRLGNADDYRGILSELSPAEEAYRPQHHENLSRLDHHLKIAAGVCRNFGALLAERAGLPDSVDEANRVLLDKLAEVRAIWGLARLGFRDIRFAGTPDFTANLGDHRFVVEVTRFAASSGKRSDVWDRQVGSGESGLFMGMISSNGKVLEAVSEAIYRKIEEKCPQLKPLCPGDSRIVWISLGRDYLTAGRYELPAVGVLSKMPETALSTLRTAVGQIKATGLYPYFSYAVLSLGRDKDDLVEPKLNEHG